MTGEEAIKILQDKIKTMEDGAICCNFGIDKDVFALAIQALEQKTCKDAISREAVLMELDKYLCGVPFDEKGIDIVIKELPSVKPQIICPIHGVYCEDCSAYEKKLNKWIGAEVLDEIKNEITMLHIFNRKNVIEIIDKYKAESEEKE